MHACLDSKMIIKGTKNTRVAVFPPSFSHLNYFSQDNKGVFLKPCIMIKNVRPENSPLYFICYVCHTPTFP
jgi:hypothetical protein